MLDKITDMMSPSNGMERSKLQRHVDLIKAIRGVPGSEYMENERKLGWSKEEFEVWLFLLWRGKYEGYFSN